MVRRKSKEELARDLAKFRAAGGRDEPTIKVGSKEAEESHRIAKAKLERQRQPEVSPVIKLEPKKTGAAKDLPLGFKRGLAIMKEKRESGEIIAEAVPFGAAGAFGLIGKGLGAFNKVRVGKTIVTGHKVGLKTAEKIVRAFQTNAKTIRVTDSLLRGVLKQYGKPAVIAAGIGAIIGTYPWAEWAQGEAREVMGFAVVNAIKTDNPEIIQEARDAQDELWDQNVWEGLARLIPGANIAVGFWNKYKALRAQAAVNDKIMADRIQQIETGETDDEKWARIREEEAEADKAAVDYYNEERKKMVEWEREAEKAARDADAAFWRAEREKQSKMEAEDRKAIADFWLAYRKESLKIANDNRPSNLNFGLL